jgi:hypothetical protein
MACARRVWLKSDSAQLVRHVWVGPDFGGVPQALTPKPTSAYTPLWVKRPGLRSSLRRLPDGVLRLPSGSRCRQPHLATVGPGRDHSCRVRAMRNHVGNLVVLDGPDDCHLLRPPQAQAPLTLWVIFTICECSPVA